jgi:PAS domain S-box-containing protein
MESWFDRAVDNPWLFISFAICFLLWRVGKFLGIRLFGKEGAMVIFLDGIREDSKEMKETMTLVSVKQVESNKALEVAIVSGLQGNTRAIVDLERLLVSAIQAKPDDGELFKVLFTNHPVPMCYVGKDYRFTKLNEACDEFFGYSSGELSRMTFQELTLGEDLEADCDNVERVAAGTLERYRMEKTYVRKDGEQVKAALYVFRYPAAGAFLHYISIIIPLK